MIDDFLKLLKKKSDEQGGPKMNRHMEARAVVAKQLSDLLGSDLAEGVKKEGLEKGLRKVTVASDSEEGLEEGLEKAKEVLDSEDEESMEDSEDESGEESESEEDMSEVEDEISKLEEQIKQLKKKKK